MCRRKQFSDKITLFLAKQAHVVEFLFVVVGRKKVRAKILAGSAFAHYFKLGLEEVMIFFRK